MASRTASFWASLSSDPSRRHGALSILGAASHDGFGRLPTIEGSSMRSLIIPQPYTLQPVRSLLSLGTGVTMAICEDISRIKEVKQPAKRECSECVKSGSKWMHL